MPANRPTQRTRRKISTTVAPETHTFLLQMVSSGRAENLADAVDRAVLRARLAERRARLDAATSAYFNSLPAKTAAAESKLAKKLNRGAAKIDFSQ